MIVYKYKKELTWDVVLAERLKQLLVAATMELAEPVDVIN
jgi:hypothetical protein